MDILEKEIEDLIWDSLTDEGSNELYLRGFPKSDYYLRQFDLGSYGIADLIGVTISASHFISINIYELKRGEVNIKTLLQAARYEKGIRSFIIQNFNILPEKISFHLYLIGKRIDTSSDFCYLIDVFDNLTILTISLDIVNGLKFRNRPPVFIKNPRPVSCSTDTQLILLESFKNSIKNKNGKTAF